MADLSGIENALSKILKTLDDIKLLLEDTFEVDLHVHDAHWHGVLHDSSVLSGESGKMFIPIVTDEVSFLLSEMNNKLDKDGNGLIFGIDFLINPEDPMCPQPLRNIELILSNDGQDIPSVKLSWFGYISTLPWT